MSEEKLYAVKNDEGKYWDFKDFYGFWELTNVSCSITGREYIAKNAAKKYGGHVVALIEEPEKIVLNKEQAKIVENARDEEFPATYISDSADYDEELLIDAYDNGYTVEKEKRYSVKVPRTDDSYFYKVDDDLCNAGDSFSVNFGDDTSRFTEAEIEHYGLQDCEKVVCADSARTTGEVKD